ncbi:MAG TPA: phosphoribosyl-AMP cyclohydrolase [Candidatus Paceibacterota bacterium]
MKSEVKKVNIIIPDFSKLPGKLVVVVVQDQNTKEVLMVAYTKKAQFKETLKTGVAVFYSRSRRRRWKKGETSGNILKVTSVEIDCDNDALLYSVRPAGPTCHTNNRSCFYRKITSSMLEVEPKKQKVEMLEVHPDIAL